ncbi:hypothetical protein, partial [Anaerotruncus colihominis]|uniref:hypothetical protein n=1 Tax=Anaerotruncus colihominis TaxID=169435 RepID=UPI0026EE53F6
QPPFDGQLYHAASRTWYNSRKAYGQGDTRAWPAAAQMANYIMPLRGHRTVTMKRYRLLRWNVKRNGVYYDIKTV